MSLLNACGLMITLLLTKWMYYNNRESDVPNGIVSIGMFFTQNPSSTHYINTACNQDNSVIDCGYLKSAQVSGVVACAFSLLATLLYFKPPKEFAHIDVFCSLLASTCQFLFSVMTIVIFRYFKVGYSTQDDINIENDADVGIVKGLSYGSCFDIWIVSSCLTFTMISLGFFLLFNKRFTDKSIAENNRMRSLDGFMTN
eukprot:gene5379-7457_t